MSLIRLGGFVNGDDVGVMNAPRGSRFVLKTLEELGVVQQLAAQDLERHGAVTNRNLLGKVNRTHPTCAQAADDTKPAEESRRKLRFGIVSLGHEASAVVQTEHSVIGVGLLTSVADFHDRLRNPDVVGILAELLTQREWPFDFDPA